ncbi:galactokinase [Nocardioides sp. AX2bis]|uniref:galactokinase n=1 Tax=Nocardioides sp. AX2bis TaxID=2653157 RepID=UPI0012F1E812|nr:galactokinase [Nocardioides sp. AX2bis]VXC13315.1 Galactokinase [Nocardioides sp. AX2bis]
MIDAGTWSAPGRVNLIGDHTDYNGGFALPCALPRRTTVVARRRDDGLLRARSTGATEPLEVLLPGARGEVGGWGAYVAGVAWSLAEAGVAVPGADLEISSDVPLGAGLSSSHSLECAVALALTGLAEVEVRVPALARIVQRAENEYVGAPTGLLDQTASLASVADHLTFIDARAETARPVPCDLAAAGLELLVVDTRAAHALTDGAYGSRRDACERAAGRLGLGTLRELTDDLDVDGALARLGELDDDPEAVRRARHVITENARVLQVVELVGSGLLREVGPVLSASHASMRDDFENSVPEVDLAVETAVGAGALGARMTGGGFGGSVVALVDAALVPAVQAAVRAAYADASLAEPGFLTVVPARGAGRDA